MNIQTKIKIALKHLAHFDPTFSDDYGNQTSDYLVLDALHNFGALRVNAAQIKDCINDRFLIQFEDAEIHASGIRLSKSEKIEYIAGERELEGTFQIRPEIEQFISNNLKRIEEIENKVINDWQEEVCEKYKRYPVVKKHCEEIIENFHRVLSKIIAKHGIETVTLLYPEEAAKHKWIDNIGNEIFEDLTGSDSLIIAISKAEIISFLKSSNLQRRDYINSIFNSSYFMYLIQIDEECSKLLKEVTLGQKLYIDNNILYSLVGLDGANALNSIHAMLRIANELGYDLWITNKSLDEFYNSLKWHMNEMKKRPPLPSELARIALEQLGADSFMTVYWKEFIEKGLKIEEFISEKSHVDGILEGLNIETTNKFRKDIEDSEELLNEISILTSICPPKTNEKIIEHDAFHRLFINKIRKGPKRYFTQAVAWFLTHDRKLPEYDRIARKGNNNLPFCLTTGQWVQINRPLIVRTVSQKDFEESFYRLITQPFLRTMMMSFSIEKAYNEVLSRLSRYENMNYALAFEIVSDTHFMITMSGDLEEEEIRDKIREQIVEKATKISETNKILGDQIKEKETDVAKLKSQLEKLNESAKRDKNTFQEEIKKLEEKISKQDEKLEKAINEKNEVMDEALKVEQERNVLKANITKYKREIKRNTFWLLMIIISLFIWMHNYFIEIPLIEKNINVIKILSQLFFTFFLLNIPFSKHWKLWVGFMVAIFLASLKFFE
ncbi:MAG: hypothetical protein V1794_06855 [Candidatus Glassbacteria bacterium]